MHVCCRLELPLTTVFTQLFSSIDKLIVLLPPCGQNYLILYDQQSKTHTYVWSWNMSLFFKKKGFCWLTQQTISQLEWHSIERTPLPRPKSPLNFNQATPDVYTLIGIITLNMRDLFNQDPWINSRECSENALSPNVKEIKHFWMRPFVWSSSLVHNPSFHLVSKQSQNLTLL